MLKFLPIEENLDNFNTILNAHQEIFENFDGQFYKIEYKGKIMYVHRNFFALTLYEYDGKYVSYEQFTMDKDYRVDSISLDDYIVYLYEDSFMLLDESGHWFSLKVGDMEGATEEDEYNGYVAFSQYNENTKETSVITYPYYFRNGRPKKIVSLEGKKPIEVAIKNRGRLLKKYFCYEGEYGTFFYTLVAIKDYGLKEFLKNGAYSLERSNSVKRYLRSFGNDKRFDFFPFCHAYQEAELYTILKNKEFLTSVPEKLISFYNDFDEKSIGDYCAIANAFKEIDKEDNLLLAFVKKDEE